MGNRLPPPTRPVVRWTTVDRDHHRVTWHDGTTWTLRATHSSLYPWMLTDGTRRQDIGAVEAADAMHAAELWLDYTDLVPRAGAVPHPRR
jgi:hypothetical protein